MKYVFLNQDNTVVGRIDDDGLMRSSGSAAAWPEYLAWIKEGNTPEPPAPPIPEPEHLTPQQKLEVAGLSIEELKQLLGL